MKNLLGFSFESITIHQTTKKLKEATKFHKEFQTINPIKYKK